MNSINPDLQQAAAKVHRTSDGLEPAVRAQSDRKQRKVLVHKIIGMTILNSASNLVLVIALVVMGVFLMHPRREYFAVDNGRIIPMVPLSVPYRKTSDVIAYAKRAMEETFALDFSNYQAQLEGVRPRYTQAGFKGVIDGLQTTGVLPMIKERRMNLTSSTGTGVLVVEGEEDGVYTWVVRFPLTVKLVGQTTEMPEQRMLATVKLRRIPTVDSVEAVGVHEVVTKPQ
jgi:intracellular multiplication protein IcmL